MLPAPFLPLWLGALPASADLRLLVRDPQKGAAYARGWGDFTTPDFTSITGRQGRSFADFAADHLAQLRGAA